MSCAVQFDNMRHPEWCGPPRALMRAGWITLMVLGFVFWWPVGLAILALTLWSKKMGCWGHHGGNRWQRKMQRMEEMMERHCGGRSAPSSSGNRAFDEYREETLRRMEEEQREFQGFLEQLRAAKDKAEFDQFMTERRNRPASPEPPQPSS